MTRATVCLALVATLGCGSAEEQEKAALSVQPRPEDVQPMPPTGHVVEWGAAGVPCQIKAGGAVPVSVIVRNAGDQVWRDMANSDKGRGAIRLGFRWWPASGAKAPVVDYTVARGDLAGPVTPGESATLTVTVVAPTAPGDYRLQFDLVEELVVWFEQRGATKLMAPVRVS